MQTETEGCLHQQTCSGCQRLGQPYSEQVEQKTQQFQTLLQLNNIVTERLEFRTPGTAHLRDRADLTIENGKIGLYAKQCREIVDLITCNQMSQNLQEFFTEFRKINWPIKKGSVRLRVSPSGDRGAWLDFSNIDIKNLLNQKVVLQQLSEMARVEIGQKHKSLSQGNHPSSRMTLGDPVLHVWFETKFGERRLPLDSYISSFTQPSHIANQKLIEIITQEMGFEKYDRAVEFGAGIGNLTFPFLSWTQKITVAESDRGALTGLKQTLRREGIESRVEILNQDFQRVSDFDFSSYELVILNPPRSGLGRFLDSLEGGPANLFLMSCFAESWVKDAVRLQQDHALRKVILYDQFPQTNHYEILSFWSRRS